MSEYILRNDANRKIEQFCQKTNINNFAYQFQKYKKTRIGYSEQHAKLFFRYFNKFKKLNAFELTKSNVERGYLLVFEDIVLNHGYDPIRCQICLANDRRSEDEIILSIFDGCYNDQN